MSHFFRDRKANPYNRLMTPISYPGRHYETGTIANALLAMGSPRSEKMVLGASGGIAFGYFIFAYTGQLPHVALLPRNTFSPFLRALDNLGIRRESRETVNPEKAESNLFLELDSGHAPLVWVDIFSLPYRRDLSNGMWLTSPVAIVGYSGDEFLIADGSGPATAVSRKDLAAARAKIKKDRFRMLVLERPDEARIAEGLKNGIETCTSLFLDKPPAGSVNNFGITGMRQFIKMLTDEKNAAGWARKFAVNPATLQSLAGTVGQPGVFDWIDTWGTAGSADRTTYAEFLDEAAELIGRPDLGEAANLFHQSAQNWATIAELCLPNEIPELARLKALKRSFARTRPADPARPRLRAEVTAAWQDAAQIPNLPDIARAARSKIAFEMTQIAELEESAAKCLRTILSS
jgi:Butirosin biosynthesis protein H, N-terminal/Domain of unknown function (DUF4872)